MKWHSLTLADTMNKSPPQMRERLAILPSRVIADHDHIICVSTERTVFI